jgi:hypothetical protein
MAKLRKLPKGSFRAQVILTGGGDTYEVAPRGTEIFSTFTGHQRDYVMICRDLFEKFTGMKLRPGELVNVIISIRKVGRK